MGVLLFIPSLVLIFFGLSTGFRILLSSTAFLQVTSPKLLLVTAQKLASGSDSSSLLVTPSFTLMGYIMESCGLSKRLTDWVYLLSGGFKGAMGLVTIICYTIFATLSGSNPAIVVAIGSILTPAIIENGYPSKTAVRLTVMAEALGPIISPNIMMIVYGTTMGVSITKMFMDDVVPGTLIAICLAVVNTIGTRKLPLKVNLERHPLKGQFLVTWKAPPTLLLSVIISGGIYGGIFTPTGSVTVGVVYNFVLALVCHKVAVKSFIDSVKEAIETSAMICFLIAGASVFCWIPSTIQVPAKIANFVVPILGGSQALCRTPLPIVPLFIGCLTEGLASIVMLIPVLAPIGLTMGANKIHLGVAFCINLVVGFMIPPFGVNLSTVVGITKQPFGEVMMRVLPFLAASFITFIPCTIFPPIVTFLPSLLPIQRRCTGMTNLLKHAYDLHIHCGLDVIPRSVTALEIAERTVEGKVKGFTTKSRYAPTCLQATMVRACYPGCSTMGTIALNASTGGPNPLAVEIAARMRAKIVQCPTFDSTSQQDYYPKHLPQYIDIQKKMLGAGRDVPSHRLIGKSGELCCKIQEILDVIQSHDLVLAAGHIIHKETFVLARITSKRGFRKLLITHANWGFAYYTIEEQQELVKLGVQAEYSCTSSGEGCAAWEKVTREIRIIGAQQYTIITDLGKVSGKHPDDGSWGYVQRLLEMGFTAGEIPAMICQSLGFLAEQRERVRESIIE